MPSVSSSSDVHTRNLWLVLESGNITVWCFCTIQATDRELVNLKCELNAALERVGQVEAEIVEERATTSRMEKQARRLHERSNADKEMISDLEVRLEDSAALREADRHAQMERYRRLEGKLDIVTKDYNAAREQVEDVQADRELWRTKWEAVMSERECATRSLDSRITYLERDNAALSMEVAFFRDRSSSLQFQLEDVTAALDVAKTDYINLEYRLEEDVTRLKAENHDRELDIKGLKQVLEGRLGTPGKGRLDASVQAVEEYEFSSSSSNACDSGVLDPVALQQRCSVPPSLLCHDHGTLGESAAAHGTLVLSLSSIFQHDFGQHSQTAPLDRGWSAVEAVFNRIAVPTPRLLHNNSVATDSAGWFSVPALPVLETRRRLYVSYRLDRDRFPLVLLATLGSERIMRRTVIDPTWLVLALRSAIALPMLTSVILPLPPMDFLGTTAIHKVIVVLLLYHHC
ncbi:hypothetical protein ONZ51_g10277 [Trametes cubensis]|uniref:Uncharacterized protein n=1 Tax=Trametes cubensis TaxID=1111947 RepID=A0AAD7TJS4_9APHY|nr:hypothetical protein ONZ51_g10277 [Trametes cubensis]